MNAVTGQSKTKQRNLTSQSLEPETSFGCLTLMYFFEHKDQFLIFIELNRVFTGLYKLFTITNKICVHISDFYATNAWCKLLIFKSIWDLRASMDLDYAGRAVLEP